MNYKNVIVKIGSSVLAPNAQLDKNLLKSIVEQLNALIEKDIQVTLVCSGAVVLGIQALGLDYRPKNINQLQALAALGQTKLMDEFNSAIAEHERLCGQILLTRDDFVNRNRYINAKHTFKALFDLKALPIVNENDTISTEEVQFGDNDTLSALVAGLLEADALIILSNVDGFLVNDKVLSEVKAIDDELLSNIEKKESAFTKGGMEAKLEAIRRATSVGTKVYLTNGRKESVITDIVLAGDNPGTLFYPGKKIAARKRWIAQAQKAQGTIVVDSGAAQALVDNGSSLLAKGIVSVEGNFQIDDTVCVTDQEGKLIAHGLTSYTSDELIDACGSKLPKPVIHRDDMVIEL